MVIYLCCDPHKKNVQLVSNFGIGMVATTELLQSRNMVITMPIPRLFQLSWSFYMGTNLSRAHAPASCITCIQ